MRVIKLMAIFALIASLFGCVSPDPFILDGPGMEYVDSEYRNDYANCLPFANIQGAPHLAIAYLGKGEVSALHKDSSVKKLFESLDAETLSQIKTYEYDGDNWFLVVPKYHDQVIIKNGENETKTEYGVPFFIKCNSEIELNVFNVTDMYFKLEVDDNGKLKGTQSDILKTEDCTTWGPDNFIWDITHLILEN